MRSQRQRMWKWQPLVWHVLKVCKSSGQARKEDPLVRYGSYAPRIVGIYFSSCRTHQCSVKPIRQSSSLQLPQLRRLGLQYCSRSFHPCYCRRYRLRRCKTSHRQDLRCDRSSRYLRLRHHLQHFRLHPLRLIIILRGLCRRLRLRQHRPDRRQRLERHHYH